MANGFTSQVGKGLRWVIVRFKIRMRYCIYYEIPRNFMCKPLLFDIFSLSRFPYQSFPDSAVRVSVMIRGCQQIRQNTRIANLPSRSS